MRRIVAITAVLASLLTGAVACTNSREPEPTNTEKKMPNPHPSLTGYLLGGEDKDGVTRIYRDQQPPQLAAIVTDGARAVTFVGPQRTFTEPSTTSAKVKTDSWVRVAPKAWQHGAWTEPWFIDFFRTYAEDYSTADVLAMAMQYQDDAPTVRDDAGVPFAGDAGFGLARDGEDVDGADFYDYLGINWKFPSGEKKQPDEQWYRKLDCSGYLRLVYGYRAGIRLSAGTSGDDGLPRTAQAMATNSPSRTIAAGDTAGEAPKSLDNLLPGDLVFFALRSDTHMSHSGIYVGKDQDGHMRFISSRTQINGPTFGDFRSRSIIDTGIFRQRLRRVIRL